MLCFGAAKVAAYVGCTLGVFPARKDLVTPIVEGEGDSTYLLAAGLLRLEGQLIGQPGKLDMLQQTVASARTVALMWWTIISHLEKKI